MAYSTTAYRCGGMNKNEKLYQNVKRSMRVFDIENAGNNRNTRIITS